MGRPRAGELTDMQQRFAVFVASGDPLSVAYRKAGYASKTAGSQAKKAHDMSLVPHVKAEIEKLRAAREKAAIEAAEECGRRMVAMWTREDSLDALRQIAQLGLASARKITFDADGHEVQTIDAQAARVAREAVDSINKMMGYDQPPTDASASQIIVQLGDAEQYAK